MDAAEQQKTNRAGPGNEPSRPKIEVLGYGNELNEFAIYNFRYTALTLLRRLRRSE